MNPLEFIDIYEQQAKAKIQGQNTFTSYDVEQIIMNFAEASRKAIYNGEYIFALEDVDNNKVTVNDTDFNMKKIITEDGKYILILQMVNIAESDFTNSDLEILATQMEEAAKIAGNIAGVLILPSNFEIALLTAKTDIVSYAKKLGFTQEDLDLMSQINSDISF